MVRFSLDSHTYRRMLEVLSDQEKARCDLIDGICDVFAPIEVAVKIVELIMESQQYICGQPLGQISPSGFSYKKRRSLTKLSKERRLNWSYGNYG